MFFATACCPLTGLSINTTHHRFLQGCSSLKASVGGQTITMAAKDDEAIGDNSIIDLTNSPTPSPGTRSPGKRPRLEPARGRLRA